MKGKQYSVIIYQQLFDKYSSYSAAANSFEVWDQHVTSHSPWVTEKVQLMLTALYRPFHAEVTLGEYKLTDISVRFHRLAIYPAIIFWVRARDQAINRAYQILNALGFIKEIILNLSAVTLLDVRVFHALV